MDQLPDREYPPTYVGIRELRADLAAYLGRVESGETLILSRAGRPIARLSPLSDDPRPPRGLDEMALLGLIGRPGRGSSVEIHRPDGQSVAHRLPVDVRVDRTVRQVRG